MSGQLQQNVIAPVVAVSAKATPTAPQQKIIDALTPAKRQQIHAFKTVLDYLFSLPTAKESEAQKIQAFAAALDANQLPENVASALKTLRGKKAATCPNKATFYRWIEDLERYQNGNALALTKKHTGRVRQAYGWEQKAIELYNMPTKPAYADVAFWLRTDHGFASATKSRVTRYLQKLPATLGKQSPLRMGKTFYKHNLSPHKILDNEVVPVGFCYEGDGHTIDVYVAHPNTGTLYRPELTIWIDRRSRLVTGWYLAKAESSISTLFALSSAILTHDHVPAMLHLDNGSGFKSRMMKDEVSGFFTRLSITPSYAIAGNSKGKGLVEGFFKIFRNRHDKKEAFKGCYCGHDMAPEIIRRLPDLVEKGKRQLPSLTGYADSVRKFINDYNNEAKAVLDGKTPLQVWQEGLLQVPVHIEADALVQPRDLRTVRKWRIRHDNRFYEHADLAHYNGTEVLIEYDLHDDSAIRVLDERERLICIAQLVGKVAGLTKSRMEDGEQKQLDGAVKRLKNKIHEKEQRAKPVITLADSAAGLQKLTRTVATEKSVATGKAFDSLGFIRTPESEQDEGSVERKPFLSWLGDDTDFD